MRLYRQNWFQVEDYLRHDDRAVLPVGSTEQHAYLSLGTDTILAERVAVEAAEPLGVLVLPGMPFGIAPGFAAFPGTVSLRPRTLVAVVTEILDTLRSQGFARFLVVNGHGGNTPAREAIERWGARWHDWWDSPKIRAAAAEIYAGEATHASWFENFPWTRLPDVELPSEEKPPVTDREALRELDPIAVKAAIGDGSYGGPYAVGEEQALAVWAAGVDEVRTLIEAL